MIKNISLLLFSLFLVAILSCNNDDDDPRWNNPSDVNDPSHLTFIPDAKFEKKLIEYGYDSILDGAVATSIINKIT